MSSDDKVSANEVKYLEMIQAVINRMAQNSFLLKGWAVTLVAGLSALSAINTNKWLAFISILPLFLFWFLDSYYLQQERKYRALYNRTVDSKSDDNIFDLRPPKSNKFEKTRYIQCLFSWTEAGMYIPFLAMVLAAWLVIFAFSEPVGLEFIKAKGRV